MLKVRILTTLEAAYYLDDRQHGFRENRSTVTVIEALIKKVVNALVDFKYCAAIFFYIAGTFDVLDWNTVAETVDNLPFFEYLKNAFKKLHFGRINWI